MNKIKLLIIAAVISFVGAFGISSLAQAVAAPTDTGSIVVQTIPGETVAQKIVKRTTSSWSWYLVRGAGFVAAAALAVLLLSGIGMVTGHTFKFLEPLTAWASHRALGIVFAVATTLHLVGLYFDHFMPFSLLQLFVPWLSSFKPVTIMGVNFGSLWVALGILAFYVTIAIVATSLLWIDKKPKIWKFTHILSYAVMAMVFFHALYLGTDLTDGLLRWAWIAGGAIIGVVVLYRLWRAKTV